VPTPRRSQAERTAATRAALLRAAREQFADRGYAAVPAEDIARRAGVTRGALYHHYADKLDLFRDVFDQLEAELSAEIRTAAEGGTAAALTRAVAAYQRPEVVRIALLDAPAVLGWAGCREIEARHCLVLIADLLRDHPNVPPAAVPLLARLVLTTLTEAALTIASAADPQAARTQAWQALGILLADFLDS
jgi:AcrR family transcriptional regulator